VRVPCVSYRWMKKLEQQVSDSARFLNTIWAYHPPHLLSEGISVTASHDMAGNNVGGIQDSVHATIKLAPCSVMHVSTVFAELRGLRCWRSDVVSVSAGNSSTAHDGARAQT